MFLRAKRLLAIQLRIGGCSKGVYVAAAQQIDYSVWIALEDFVPIALTAFGGWQLASWMKKRDGKLALCGRIATIFLTLGGGGKAVWKLIRSLDGPDIKPLAGALFPLLATGFSILAWAMYQHDRHERGLTPKGSSTRHPLVLPSLFAAAILVLAFVLSAANNWSRAYKIPTLGVATLGSLTVVIMGCKAAKRRGRAMVAAGFILNFVGVLVLTRLARLERQTISLQWFEQIVNSTATAMFAWSCLQLANSNKLADDGIQPRSSQRNVVSIS
jgi:hypothetical protein